MTSSNIFVNSFFSGTYCLENPMNSMKGQKDRTLKDEPPRLVGANLILEFSEEITPERMKRQSQSKKKKNHPVVDVTGDGSKVQCCKEQYCIGTWMFSLWIKVNWKWSSGDGMHEHRHFRNQWTKMDWNVWI